MPEHSLDNTDFTILDELQKDGKISNAKLASQLAMSESPCWRRLKKLEDEGFIEGYHAKLNRRKVGYGVLSFVTMTCALHDEKTKAEFEALVKQSENIQSCHNTAGNTDFVMQVVARDLDDYSHFVDSVLRKLPGVVSVQSNLSLRELKSSTRLPIK
ncbi:Lrp/AsnC family transcriptional regulator [Corallincola platygyrae]|uniref:Lrp/AsnC family transcriptional regulator n=1 Tax=Corallincola platygyrae TaxID=1193278 RepID=A0ABW4XQP5_9GAMM